MLTSNYTGSSSKGKIIQFPLNRSHSTEHITPQFISSRGDAIDNLVVISQELNGKLASSTESPVNSSEKWANLIKLIKAYVRTSEASASEGKNLSTELFLQGSYSASTTIKPVHDVDIDLVISSPPYYTSFEVENSLSSLLQLLKRTRAKDSPQALQHQEESNVSSTSHNTEQQILRIHYVQKILSDLEKIQKHCGQPAAAAYADSLLRTMREVRDSCPNDPYTELIMALHNSMAVHNRWVSYRPEQYKGAYEILKDLANKNDIQDEELDDAIIELDNLGFETSPLSMPSNFHEFDESSDED